MAWYEKWAIMVIAAAFGVGAYNWVRWPDVDVTVVAYWVQALGSIAAIFGAAWIASNQYRKQIMERRRSTTLQASICCDSAESTYVEILALIKENPRDEDIVSTRTKILMFLQRSFAAHMNDMGAVAVGDLTYHDAVVFSQARRLCGIMENVIGIVLIEPPNSNLDQITEILNERFPFAKDQAAFLRISHHKMNGRGSMISVI